MTTITVHLLESNGTRHTLAASVAQSLMRAAVAAGLDGIERRLAAPPSVGAPYAGSGESLPTTLGAALDALSADAELVRAFTPQVVDWFVRVKRFELERHAAADDSDAWQAREYFSRF